MNLKIILIISTLFLVLPFASAITGSIGNARMVLRADVEEGKTTTIEKSILVKNVNNISVNILLEPSGDLADSVIFFEDDFTLLPGEERKAKFIIEVDKPGLYETKINVFFSPIDEKGPGVVLASTIIINAKGEGEFPEEEEEPEEEIVEEVEKVETEKEEEEAEEEGVGVSVGGAHAAKVSKDKLKINPLIVIFIVLAGIVGGFAIFLKRTNG